MRIKKMTILLSLCLTAVIFLSACSSGNTGTNKANNSSNSSQSAELKPIDTKKLADLMQKIQSETGVSSTNASRDKDTVNMDITLKDDADAKNAKQLGEKYVSQLKEVYSCKKANINIIQKGKKIVTVQ